MLDAALNYARRGWLVIPIRPGTKTPACQFGVRAATSSPTAIQNLWDAAPDAGVGIAGGGDARLVFLDIDGELGESSLSELEAKLGALPPTLTVRTPRGGRHLYFTFPGLGELPKNSAGKLAPCIDVRSALGYVVAPPTPNYEWLTETAPAMLPAAWAATLVEPAPTPAPTPVNGSSTGYVAAALTRAVGAVAGAAQGERNMVLNREAYSLAGLAELTDETITSELLAAAQAAGLKEREARKTIASGIRAGRTAPRVVPEPPKEERVHKPEIFIGTDLSRVVDESSEALLGTPNLFQRDGQLVRVVRVAEDEADASVLAGTPQIRLASIATLREILTNQACFLKQDGRSATKVRSALPPDVVLAALAARGEWRHVPPLAGVVEAPTLRPDGSLLAEPGYDGSTGYLYMPAGEYPEVPTAPSQADAARALGELAEVFTDFPFASEADAVVPIAAILTLLARPAIRGAVPAFVFDANTPGAGKTLQADAVTLIVTGRPASKMTFPADDAELEKVLAAYALRDASLITFDNVLGRFGGGPLDRVLTAGRSVELRVLGRSEVPSLRWRAVIFVTGNNLDITGDTTRRVLVSRLESPEERPEDRTGFRHPDLLGWVEAERARLVTAALTILRAWVVAGRPLGDCRTWGSFEAWAAIVPPALHFAGGANPMQCRITATTDDPTRRALLTILEHWPRLGVQGVTIREAVDALYPGARLRGDALPDSYDDLREALETFAPPAPGRPPSAQKLGNALRRFRNRYVGGRCLDTAAGRAGVVRWLVRGGNGGNGGHVPTLRARNAVVIDGVSVETSPPTPPSPPVDGSGRGGTGGTGGTSTRETPQIAPHITREGLEKSNQSNQSHHEDPKGGSEVSLGGSTSIKSPRVEDMEKLSGSDAPSCPRPAPRAALRVVEDDEYERQERLAIQAEGSL